MKYWQIKKAISQRCCYIKAKTTGNEAGKLIELGPFPIEPCGYHLFLKSWQINDRTGSS